MDKENVRQISIHNGILVANYKKESLPFVTTWIDLQEIMLNEIGHTENDEDRNIQNSPDLPDPETLPAPRTQLSFHSPSLSGQILVLLSISSPPEIRPLKIGFSSWF